MSLEEKYKKNNEDVQKYVMIEIENIKKGLSEKNLDELEVILNELKKTRNNKSLPLSYPRIVVDSWDFQDKLGIELLNLAELYKCWK